MTNRNDYEPTTAEYAENHARWLKNRPTQIVDPIVAAEKAARLAAWKADFNAKFQPE